MAPGFCWVYLSALFLLSSPWFLSCLLVRGEQVEVEVFLRERRGGNTVLQGEVMEASWDHSLPGGKKHLERDLEGDLVLVQDEGQQQPSQDQGQGQDQNRGQGQGRAQPDEPDTWIGVVPVKVEDRQTSSGNQESFAAAVVNKMKRALVLGASALIILALNQNSVREMDLSQVLSKPVIIIQTSENVTKLIGALLRGLHATAKITYKSFLQDNLGATLTLWSTCGRSRGGLYGEWQGVICTGETNSQVQKYLQQLWNTVLLAALILCTGVIVQARWQYQENQLNDELELLPKQVVVKRLSSLKTRMYRQPSPWYDPALPAETDCCAVCLDPFNSNQCLRVLPCLHEFHQDCVDPWLLLQHTCPLCKRSILSNLCRDS